MARKNTCTAVQASRHQLLWFVLLWCAGVLALAALSFVLHLLMRL
jgi:hypothetical protein